MQLKLILIVLNSKFILNKCQHSSLFKTKKTKLYNFKNDIWDITNLNRTLKSFKPTIFSKVCLKHSIFNCKKKILFLFKIASATDCNEPCCACARSRRPSSPGTACPRACAAPWCTRSCTAPRTTARRCSSSVFPGWPSSAAPRCSTRTCRPSSSVG